MQRHMKVKIQYSPGSLQDLDDIWSYISLELCNPDAAENTVNNILDTIDLLADFPESGALLIHHVNIETNYRYITSGNYIGFYRFENNIIYVDRILYAKRDYTKLLELK